MEKYRRWREQMADALEIPGDLACQEAIVTASGSRSVVVENYRGITRYTREEIILSTRRGKVRIYGKRLEIPCYTPQEMRITGCIAGILFLP